MRTFKEYIVEAKSDYQIYHNSYSAVADEIIKYVKKMGYTLDDESDKENIGSQMFDVLGSGPKKPSDGKTNKLHFDLYKNNKEQKKKLHAQVYGTGGKFELNMYIN